MKRCFLGISGEDLACSLSVWFQICRSIQMGFFQNLLLSVPISILPSNHDIHVANPKQVLHGELMREQSEMPFPHLV
jgi:hypothetical protein